MPLIIMQLLIIALIVFGFICSAGCAYQFRIDRDRKYIALSAFFGIGAIALIDVASSALSL